MEVESFLFSSVTAATECDLFAKDQMAESSEFEEEYCNIIFSFFFVKGKVANSSTVHNLCIYLFSSKVAQFTDTDIP